MLIYFTPNIYSYEPKFKLKYYPWTFISKSKSKSVESPKTPQDLSLTNIGFSFTPEWNAQEINDRPEYHVDFKLYNFAALVNWHPWQSEIRITSGLIYSKADNKFDPVILNTYNISGHTYSLAADNINNRQIFMQDFAPFVGLGWDSRFGKYKNFVFTADLGLSYFGEAKSNFTNLNISSAPKFLQPGLIEEQRRSNQSSQLLTSPLFSTLE